MGGKDQTTSNDEARQARVQHDDNHQAGGRSSHNVGEGSKLLGQVLVFVATAFTLFFR